MNSTFASSYELLLSAISELELQKDSFVLHPGVDFSRKRKISFRDTILSLLTMQGWLSFYYIPWLFPAQVSCWYPFSFRYPPAKGQASSRCHELPVLSFYTETSGRTYLWWISAPGLWRIWSEHLLWPCGQSCKPSGNGKEAPTSSISMRCMIFVIKDTQIYGSKDNGQQWIPCPGQMLGNISTLPERSYWLTGDMKLITFLPISWQKACLCYPYKGYLPQEGSRMVSGCLTGNWTKTWIFYHTGTVHSKRSCPL